MHRGADSLADQYLCGFAQRSVAASCRGLIKVTLETVYAFVNFRISMRLYVIIRFIALTDVVNNWYKSATLDWGADARRRHQHLERQRGGGAVSQPGGPLAPTCHHGDDRASPSSSSR